MEQISNIIDKSVNLNNHFFKNDYFRTFLLLISGVFMGYTLQPVPKWLNKLFDTSPLIKFLVLFISGCISVYPLNKNNIILVFVGSVLTLIFFQCARYLDIYIEEKNEKT